MRRTTKQAIQSLLSRLPDDCSFEDVQYHLFVMEKVHRGLEAVETEGTISQQAAERLLSKWVIE